jgi:hypothetical protein
MDTSHMNKDIWDMLKRVLEYEFNIMRQYILDPYQYTDRDVLLFKVVCSFKIAGF